MAESPTSTLQLTSLTPSLTVSDLRQGLDFFRGLGFEVEERWEKDGELLGAMLKAARPLLPSS